MRIPVHSPWLPGHIGVVQTILVLLTTAGLFLDRPYIYYGVVSEATVNYLELQVSTEVEFKVTTLNGKEQVTEE